MAGFIHTSVLSRREASPLGGTQSNYSLNYLVCRSSRRGEPSRTGGDEAVLWLHKRE